MTSVLIREKQRSFETNTEKPCEDRAETAVTCPQAKDTWGPRQLEELEGPSAGASRGSTALPTPSFQTSGLLNWERVNSCCFLPSSLGQLLQWLQDTDSQPQVCATPAVSVPLSPHPSSLLLLQESREGEVSSLS